MNKLSLIEALKSGFSINGNSIFYQNHKIDINLFLIEMNKLHFTHSIQTSISIFKENLLKNEKSVIEIYNERI